MSGDVNVINGQLKMMVMLVAKVAEEMSTGGKDMGQSRVERCKGGGRQRTASRHRRGAGREH